jgi:ketosteroid isomerase-like protein
MVYRVAVVAIGALLGSGCATRLASQTDSAEVARLDAEYQHAVKTHDAATMSRILADDFVLVTGRGRIFSKADLLMEARDTAVVYEHQEDISQTVRLWQNTAVVTALLWVKGTNQGQPFDRQLWFSDTYVRTPSGWRYVFGQSSIPLSNSP